MSEMILDGRGIIIKTSSDSCVVSATLDDGSSKSFIFNKILFYTFGEQCEGKMTNILESGMEVELCYKISHPARKTRVVAVWLGEKPDLSKHMAMLLPIYDVSGRFLGSVEGDYVLAEDADYHVVYINKNVLFMDGAPFKPSKDFGMQTEIVFDAIPFELEHPSGASYQATCAWIGPKPRLLDRFDLGSSDFDCRYYGEDTVEGTVAVIPNDSVALVDVAFESISIKVLLFRGSFKQDCASILDLVDVGDSVSMQLGSKLFFPGRLWWFAAKAYQTSNDVSPESDVAVCREDAVKVPEKVNIESSPELDRDVYVLDKPRREFDRYSEVLFNVPPLSGVISRLSHDHGACITLGNLKIYVHHDNLYHGKRKFTVEEFLSYVSPGNNVVYFEAMLLSTCFNLEKGECTHEATSAWVKENRKPSLGVYIRLPPCKPSALCLLERVGQIFYGVVSEYVSPFTAFAFIPEESVYVIVHVNFFLSPPQYPSKDSSEVIFITNHVKLRDTVKFKLMIYGRTDRLSAYDISAVSYSEEPRDKPSLMLNTPVSSGEIYVPVHNPPLEKIEVTADSHVGQTSVVDSQSVPSTPGVGDLFSRKCVSPNKGFLLNCQGILIVEAYQSDFIVEVKHVFGTSLLDPRLYVSFTGEAMLGSKNMLMFHCAKVRFDAEMSMTPLKNRNIYVVRLWKEHGVRPDCETLLAPYLACIAGDTPDVIVGIISSIPFHDAAIATTDKNVSVLVTLESLVPFGEINLNTMTIDSYVSVGDVIVAKVEKRNFGEMFCFRAVKCFRGENIPQEMKSDSSLKLNESQRLKWIDIWGKDHSSYQKAFIVYKDGKYLVPFVSPDVPGLVLNLDLFESRKVFVHCKSADPRMFQKYVGQKISFHVLVKPCVDRGNSSKGMYVACAWIGEEPPPKLVLKELLSVPKDVIGYQWRYEAVVASFPLPFHALCYIGHVPCLVRILSDEDGKFDKNADLAVGDRLVVTAYEDDVDDCVVVLSNDLQNLQKASERPVKDVYRNVAGTIVALPKPVGKIKVAGAGFEVAFELCHLRRLGKARSSRKNWLASMKTKLTVGKQVFCSAIKTRSKNVPYRAFEVFFC